MITSVVAQATDNATMARNATTGKWTDGGNSTDAVGGISGVEEPHLVNPKSDWKNLCPEPPVFLFLTEERLRDGNKKK